MIKLKKSEVCLLIYCAVAILLMTLRNEVFSEATIGVEVPYSQSFLSSLPYIAADALLLYGILRPRSYQQSWRRALSALIIFLFYTLINLITIVHAPLWHIAHAAILMGLLFFIFILFLYSLVLSVSNSSGQHSNKNTPT